MPIASTTPRRRERQDAEAQRNAGPDGVPDRAEQRRAEGHQRSQNQRITPLVPRKFDQDEAGQERAEDAADHTPGVDLADRGAGPLVVLLSRSTASLATTGLTVPIDSAGRKKTSVTTNRIRYGQFSEIDTGPSGHAAQRRSAWLSNDSLLAVPEHLGQELRLGVQRE